LFDIKIVKREINKASYLTFDRIYTYNLKQNAMLGENESVCENERERVRENEREREKKERVREKKERERMRMRESERERERTRERKLPERTCGVSQSHTPSAVK
jgi:septal ring factor EnvC (AmiA/AmiB activator)